MGTSPYSYPLEPIHLQMCSSWVMSHRTPLPGPAGKRVIRLRLKGLHVIIASMRAIQSPQVPFARIKQITTIYMDCFVQKIYTKIFIDIQEQEKLQLSVSARNQKLDVTSHFWPFSALFNFFGPITTGVFRVSLIIILEYHETACCLYYF